MHGDNERAAVAAARWKPAAKAAGFELLALQCPEASWWKWNGDPQWVKDRVAKVEGIDRDRIYAIGWSGGATYLGMRAQSWNDTFAAIVVHGGGIAPSDETCTTLPAYFLVGDKNPLHHLAVRLHEFFVRCKSTVAWDVVRDGDHAKERRALTVNKARAILDWLSAHTRK